MRSERNEQSFHLIKPREHCFCLETHMHTSQSSACGRGAPEEMVLAYKQAGYDGIIVTDHFMNGNSCIDRSLPWEEQVDRYCLAYEKAKQCGDEIGFSVFFGFEFNYLTTEFITLGVGKDWLKAHPEIMTIPVEDYLTLIRDHGGMNIHAHPFREARYITEHRFYPDLVDAVEVINLGNHDPIYNSKALHYAQEHALPMTSGSDCHAPDHHMGAGLAMDQRPSGIKDIMDTIRSGQGYTLLGEELVCNRMHEGDEE